MNVNKFSLKKRWYWIFLVLLSPGAFSEKLDFDYEQPVSDSLNPLLLKLGNVCHSLVDPMDIKVRFKEGMITDNVNIVMTIEGADLHKGYTGMTAVDANKVVDDLYSRWKISTDGNVIYDYIRDITVPVTKPEYVDQFCFADHIIVIDNKYGFVRYHPPIYDNPPYFYNSGDGRDFSRYCLGRSQAGDKEMVYWPDDFYNPPQLVRDGLQKGWEEYQGKYIFYRGKNIVPAGTVDKTEAGTTNTTDVDWDQHSQTSNKNAYVFPIKFKNSSLDILRKGEFNFKLNNRNVLSLTLDISMSHPGTAYPDDHNIFKWERDDNSLDHTLVFKGAALKQNVISAGEVLSDPYQSFYDNKKINRSFRGTLVSNQSLTSGYEDYIKKIPLSLPPKKDGDINLVNTQGLEILIGRFGNYGSGDFGITLYGQPLKFGPLYNGKKEVASAMQVRNACY